MRFRPCIDIHNGKVKQIVGSSLRDRGETAEENFVSDKDAAFYAGIYREDGLEGEHVICLNPASSPYYGEDKKQAFNALLAFPGGLQAGGGITAENAAEFLSAGASHVIVSSYVFSGEEIRYENLSRLTREVGKEHLVLDLSCRKKGDGYYIATERWQNTSGIRLKKALFEELSSYCSEFLVHAADAEGKRAGIDKPLAELLAGCAVLPITYAGGIGSLKDLDLLREAGQNRLDVTVGSALDLFGGSLSYREVLAQCDD